MNTQEVEAQTLKDDDVVLFLGDTYTVRSVDIYDDEKVVVSFWETSWDQGTSYSYELQEPVDLVVD